VKSELTAEFIEAFRALPQRVQRAARKNYKLWKKNPDHPGLEFKRVKGTETSFSIRVGIGWRAVGAWRENDKTMVWFWIGSHAEYDKLLKSL
jgi:hypothetical protein